MGGQREIVTFIILVNLILFVLFTYLAVLCSAFMWDGRFVAYNGLSKVVSYEYNAVWSVIAGSAKQDFGAVIARGWLVPFVRLFAYTALVNLNLAVFNLIPLPPLDGYHLFNDLLFKGRFQLSQQAFQIAQVVVLVACFSGVLSGVLNAAFDAVEGGVLNLFLLIAGMVTGLPRPAFPFAIAV